MERPHEKHNDPHRLTYLRFRAQDSCTDTRHTGQHQTCNLAYAYNMAEAVTGSGAPESAGCLSAQGHWVDPRNGQPRNLETVLAFLIALTA